MIATVEKERHTGCGVCSGACGASHLGGPGHGGPCPEAGACAQAMILTVQERNAIVVQRQAGPKQLEEP